MTEDPEDLEDSEYLNAYDVERDLPRFEHSPPDELESVDPVERRTWFDYCIGNRDNAFSSLGPNSQRPVKLQISLQEFGLTVRILKFIRKENDAAHIQEVKNLLARNKAWLAELVEFEAGEVERAGYLETLIKAGNATSTADCESVSPERPDRPEATYEENTPEEQARIDKETPLTELPAGEPYIHQPVESYYHPVIESPAKYVIENWPNSTEEERINIAFTLGMKRGRIGQKRAKTEATAKKRSGWPIGLYFEAIEATRNPETREVNWYQAAKLFNEKHGQPMDSADFERFIKTFKNRVKRFNQR